MVSLTYGANIHLLRDLWLCVDVDLIEGDIGVHGGVLLEDGADHPARPAPSCPKVDDDGLVLFDLLNR